MSNKYSKDHTKTQEFGLFKNIYNFQFQKTQK